MRAQAIIATARKFFGIIYNTLKNKWVFEDFSTFKIAGQQNRELCINRLDELSANQG